MRLTALPPEMLQNQLVEVKHSMIKKIYGPPLQIGSRVLIRNVTEKGGPGKIRSYWEDNIYVIKRQKGEDSPVFELEPENGRGRTRVMHRNMLLPCDFLPITSDANKTVAETRAKKKHLDEKNKMYNTQAQLEESEEESDQDLCDVVLTWPAPQPHSTSLDPTAVEFVPQTNIDVPVGTEPFQTTEEEQEDPIQTQPVEEGVGTKDTRGADSDSDSEFAEETEQMSSYPKRQRRKPQTLTYDILGKPSFAERAVATKALNINGYWRPW